MEIKVIKPKRPSTLTLHSSYSKLTSKQSVWSLNWMDFLPKISSRRTFAVLQGYDSLRGLRKSKCLQVVAIIMVILIVTTYRPNISLLQRRIRNTCSDGQVLYMNGKVVCSRNSEMKYLTYQPPGGGWNNQRLAFENAVILAKMLNRTLIVHPMATHKEILKIKKQQSFELNYESYNALPSDALLSLSQVIDLRKLSKLLPVKEIHTNHAQFLKDYSHLSWKRVCHNGLIGAWVDSLPDRDDKESWDALDLHTKTWQLSSNLPSYKRICAKDRSIPENNTAVWGILDELSNQNEDVIYFEEGSMFFRQMLFFNLQRTLDTHKWIFWNVKFAPAIWHRLRLFRQRVHFPYNAMHVRRTDHPASRTINQDFWLELLNKREFQNITSTLYIATDEKNLTWFQPFRDAGFDLLFAKDFEEIFESVNNVEEISQDILGLTEQLICTHAAHFVGSYYSTFSLYINRLRKQSNWRGGLVQHPFFGVTWVAK